MATMRVRFECWVARSGVLKIHRRQVPRSVSAAGPVRSRRRVASVFSRRRLTLLPSGSGSLHTSPVQDRGQHSTSRRDARDDRAPPPCDDEETRPWNPSHALSRTVRAHPAPVGAGLLACPQAGRRRATSRCASVAQRIEPLLVDELVAGSNPARGTKLKAPRSLHRGAFHSHDDAGERWLSSADHRTAPCRMTDCSAGWEKCHRNALRITQDHRRSSRRTLASCRRTSP